LIGRRSPATVTVEIRIRLQLDRPLVPRADLPVYTDFFSAYCEILLTQGGFAKGDPEDRLRLSQFRWCFKNSPCNVYAVRNCTTQQNGARPWAAKGATSHFKGAANDRRREKRPAYIKKHRKQRNAGYFDDEVDTAQANHRTAREPHGEYTALAFPKHSYRAESVQIALALAARRPGPTCRLLLFSVGPRRPASSACPGRVCIRS
jgi:hypothetical protein